MKKLLVMIFVVVMLLSMAACGQAPVQEPTPNPTQQPSEAPQPEKDSPSEDAATYVLKNGAIYTMNEALDVVSAIAVRGSEIVYVGDDAGADAYVGAETKVVDLGGKMVTPGFINGHDHIVGAEYGDRTELGLYNYPSDLAEYAKAVKEYADANPDLSVLIINTMDLKAYGSEIVNNKWVSEALPDRPAIVSDASGHGRLLNKAAMDALNITDDIEAPAGATVYRYEDGTLTGYFSDFLTVCSELEASVEYPESIWFDAFEEFQGKFVAAGVTTLDDGGSSVETVERLSRLDREGGLDMRFQVPIMSNDTEAYSAEYAEECVEKVDSVQKYTSDFLHMNQVKMIIDGVPEGMSALLLEPYAESAGMGSDFYGPTYTTQEKLNEMVSVINKAGYQVLIHSMGDGGCRASIEAFVKSQKENNLPDMRNVVIHATLIADEDIALAGENNIYLGVQPVWFYMDPQYSDLELNVFGEERFYREYNTRDRLEAGCIMTGSADYSASWDFKPLTGIEICATQGSPYEGQQGDPAYVRNADQTISVMDALKIYTINGAKQCRMEDLVGSLEVGKKADMVILAEDITKIDVLDISETEIISTICDGRVVYGKAL